MPVRLFCSCGAANKVSNRKYKRHRGGYVKCKNCGAPVKIMKLFF